MKQFADHLKDYSILLASRSPRRQNLLREAGIPFELVLKEEVEEIFPDGLTPGEVASYLAKLKADAYLDGLSEGNILITADTLVVLGNKILGKPPDRDGALSMLAELSGRPHEVITGVCLTSTERQVVFTESTMVWFDDLESEEIEEYVDTFHPYDKAGSYGIQEWIGYMGIHRIDGSYFNVMGLPIHRLYRELRKFTGYEAGRKK